MHFCVISKFWRNCASPSDVDWTTLKKNTTDFPFCPKPFFPKSTLPFQKSCLGFFGWGPDDAALFPTLPLSESSGSPPLLSLVCKPGAMNFKRRLNSGRKSRAHLKASIKALESCRSGHLLKKPAADKTKTYAQKTQVDRTHNEMKYSLKLIVCM